MRATWKPNWWWMRLGLICALALSGSVLQARASQVRLLTLEEMTGRAARIFAGRCLRVKAVEAGAHGIPMMEVTFEVHQSLKGDARGTVTVRQPGRVGQRGGGIPGLPSFRAGEEVLLFLYGESPSGNSSPVGLGQGKFTVLTDKEGHRWAVNEFGNRNLLPAPAPGNGRRREDLASGRAMGMDELLERVRTLLHEAVADPETP